MIKVRNGFFGVLALIYVLSFFSGTLGIECARGTNTKALWLLSLFWILWTSFVFFVLKDDERLRLQSVTASGLIDATKEALFTREVKDYDEENQEKMITTQKRMYITLSLTITGLFVIQSAQKAIFIWFWEEPYGLLTSQCVNAEGKVLEAKI